MIVIEEVSGIIAGRVLAVAARFPAKGGQTFRVYEAGWLGSKLRGARCARFINPEVVRNIQRVRLAFVPLFDYACAL